MDTCINACTYACKCRWKLKLRSKWKIGRKNVNKWWKCKAPATPSEKPDVTCDISTVISWIFGIWCVVSTVSTAQGGGDPLPMWNQCDHCIKAALSWARPARLSSSSSSSGTWRWPGPPDMPFTVQTACVTTGVKLLSLPKITLSSFLSDEAGVLKHTDAFNLFMGKEGR